MWDQRWVAGDVLREGGSGEWCWVRVYFLGWWEGDREGEGGESPWRVTVQMRRFVPPRSRVRNWPVSWPVGRCGTQVRFMGMDWLSERRPRGAIC